MERGAYWKIVEKSMEKDAQERTIVYLTECLRPFLRRGERVLICFMEHKEGNLSWVMEQAILRCHAEPVLWGPDHRWKTLLQQAFFSRASTIIGPPLIILGLSKLKKYNATPLSIRRAITAGYPCPGWMIDGIEKGFDCESGGCFAIGQSGAIAGFNCQHQRGIHIRQDEYDVDIVDENGKSLPLGEYGEIVISPKTAPELRYAMGENARFSASPCPCGSTAPLLLEMGPGRTEDPSLLELGHYLQSWTSILDCRILKTESGLEMEIVCFPGEKLPKLPTVAKLTVRPWMPKHDEPFWYVPTLKVAEK